MATNIPYKAKQETNNTERKPQHPLYSVKNLKELINLLGIVTLKENDAYALLCICILLS